MELSISYDDLLLEVAQFLGYGSDARRTDVDSFVQAGVRRFYFPPAVEGIEAGYQWSFMCPTTTIETADGLRSQELPSDLGRVIGSFFYDQSEHRASIVQVSEERYQALISRSTDESPPQVARIRHAAAASGQRLEVAWWPIPDDAYTLTYSYEAYAGKLSADNPYPLGGMRHADLVVQSCLAVAEQRANDERGIHTAEFERMLAAAIQRDRRLGARSFGHMGAPSAVEPPRRGDTGSTYPISYNGVDV